MSHRPVKNDAEHAINVAGFSIQPGETRLIDESLLPKQPPAAAPPDEPIEEFPVLQAIRDGNVASVASAILDLSAADLAQLAALEEQDESPRKGVLTAIQEDSLARADLQTQVDSATADEIKQLMEDHASRRGFMEILGQAITRLMDAAETETNE